MVRVPLWRRTPPAIFPVTLGFLGLSLAWRGAATVLPIPTFIGDLLMGVATLFFLFFFVSYIAKFIARPAVLMEDMKTPPARAGVSAMLLSILILSAVLNIFGIRAGEIWLVGVALYLISILVVGYSIYKLPAEARVFSPFQYLSFVGTIVAPVAGISLGYIEISIWMMWLALPPYIAITIGYGLKLMRVRPPHPLRPSLMMGLAPTALFGIAFGQLGIEWAFQLFYWQALIWVLVLFGVSIWMTEGGWTPIWGGFTFPIAAFLNLQILALSKGAGLVATTALTAGLLIGTPLVLYIVFKHTKAWIRGDLTKNTAAAVA